LNLKRGISLGIIVYLIGVSLSYFFLLKPISDRLGALKARKSIVEDYYLLTTARLSMKAGSKGCFVNRDELNSVRTELIDLARRCQVTPSSVDVLSPEEKMGRGLIKIPIEVHLRGNYHAIGSFIGRLEGSETLFVVRDLHVSSDTGKKAAHRAQLILYVIGFGK
jgi:Tfp pilus assembly protein PilO